jgi:quinone-modifying oxidoreductase subunit QmoB
MSEINNNTGAFICKSCGIADCVNTQKLREIADENVKFGNCIEVNNLCGVKGLGIINNSIKDAGLSKILIAACSPRVKTTEFDFGKEILVERVNLREQVAGSHEPGDEDTQMLAEDMMRMGLARLENIEIPVPFIPEQLYSDILVLGAGITGIAAAIDGARAGYKVVIIEKEEETGGFLRNLKKQVPAMAPWDKAAEPVLKDTLSRMQAEENIRIKTKTEILEITGQPGEFQVRLVERGEEKNLQVGAIVAATGWESYNPSGVKNLNYSDLSDVVTSVEFEKMAVEGSIKRPSDGQEIRNVLFVQCAGSRDKDHLPYCSSVCCGTSLKQAQYIREANPEAKAFIIYKDIRMPGMSENYYKEVQKDSRIFLTKGEVAGITQEDDQLLVNVKDSLVHDDMEIAVDLVVLAVGMVPRNSEALNLAYRQGKGLPGLKYDFPDSHFICFPYETRRTGIYAAGGARAPLSIGESMDDAAGAMMKAIQCVEATKRGEAVHPRSGDQSYPELYMQRCTDCKRCTEECPFGSYDETEKGTPLPNPSRCRRCGICMGSCPERIISFKDYSIQSVSAMIKAVEVPDEFEEKPRVLALVCENDAYPAIDMAGMKGLKYSPFVRIIPVRCLGSVNKVWISDALSRGFDGILQIGCKPGDDYQCHFIHGSELTETRGENIQETLQTMMLEPERIRTEFVEIDEYDRIPEIINDYMEEIELIGPNPFKDM